MFNSSDIDTNGFPYVHGISQYIYTNTQLPETESECNKMITEITDTAKDVASQLNIDRLNLNSDREWRKSALGKLRTLNNQKRILIAKRVLDRTLNTNTY